MDENIKKKRIASKYVIKIILSYIKDKDRIYSLFTYSKKFQKELNFKIADYKEIYYEKRINYEDYLYIFFTEDKNELEKKFKNDLYKYEKAEENEIKKFSINYFKKYLQNNKNKDSLIFESDKKIDIFSPFFDILSETDFFGEIFSIVINPSYILEYNLNDFYISKFNKLNKSDIKYSSIIFNSFDDTSISFLKNYNVNFNYIKKLVLKVDTIFSFTNFINELFSFGNISNKLKYFSFEYNTQKSVYSNKLEILNNFQALEYLNLKNINFESKAELKLKNLKHLVISECKNISFNENIFLKLKSLTFNRSEIIKPKLLLECPELEKCNFTFFEPYEVNLENSNEYNEIIDFSNLPKLKYFEGDMKYFLVLKNNSYESVTFKNLNSTLEIEKKVLQKLLVTSNLKEIIITYSNHFNVEEILKIEGVNLFVKKLKITISSFNKNFPLYKIQEKFPNLSKLIINTSLFCSPSKAQLEIKEKSNCKVNSFEFDSCGYYTQFYCQSYDKIESIELKLYDKMINLKNSFPIFSGNSNVLFNSLIKFHFDCWCNCMLNFNIINNIYKNFDNMPNLRFLTFKCYYQDKVELGNEFFHNFIKKIFSIKSIRKINISIDKKNSLYLETYSKDKLNKLFPSINLNRFYELNIEKYKI